MVTRELLELLYDAASIQRWNDHLRPHQGFSELDKQAHKLIYAYVLARFEQMERGLDVDWIMLIEGSLFEFLQRIKLTDIKPPILHELMAEFGRELNQWALGELLPVLKDPGFVERFRSYLLEPQYAETEKRILGAAHYLASNWEFQIIYRLNQGLYGLDRTRHEIEGQIKEHAELIGVRELGLGSKVRHFLDLAGQLRFQQRWAQTPRLPQTSVLGHMLIVAICSYLCTIPQRDFCSRRRINAFWAGLFHDLPEVLTRDIIHPVKRSVPGLDKLLERLENRQLEERVYPLLPQSWQKEIRYLVECGARDQYLDGDEIRHPEDGIPDRFNLDQCEPIDGRLVKICDEIAAYYEAALSLRHGITSHHLEDSCNALSERYLGREPLVGFDFSSLFNCHRQHDRNPRPDGRATSPAPASAPSARS